MSQEGICYKWCDIVSDIMYILLLILLSISTINVLCFLEAKKKHQEYFNIAERILQNMDTTVDPCDDFYHFACGKFIKTEKIDADKSSSSSFEKVRYLLKKQILPLLTKLPKGLNDLRPFKMARHFYKMCLREDLIEARGIGFVLQLLKKVGGWPVLEGQRWNATNFNWVETVYKLEDLNLEGQLIDITIGADNVNSFKHVVKIDQISFGLNQEYLIQGRENKLVKAYSNFMENIAILFGAKRQVAIRELSDLLDFEIELAKIALKKNERRYQTKLYHPMKVKDLQRKHPIVNWNEYLIRIMNNVTLLDSNDIVIVKSPKYLDKLHKLLSKTDKRIVANFLLWQAVKSTLHYLTKAVRKTIFKFKHFLTGAKKDKPRWDLCLEITTQNFKIAVGAMYIRYYFDKKAKGIVTDMVKRGRQAMVETLNNVGWMDKDTRTKALEKAHAMEEHLAFPEELLDDKKIEEFYEKLEITKEQFFESKMKLLKFFKDDIISRYPKLINKTEWRNHGNVAVVNAFYSGNENAIIIPAGILQNVFFNPYQPKYINYGAIGFSIGHEITHGFDDTGKQYDKFGNMVEWWDPQTNKKFKKRIQCVIDQANNYIVQSVNMSLNGFNTQGENIADLGGAKLSEKAYNSWVADNYEEPSLVLLKRFTPRQIFWLSSANIWCTVYREQALRKLITTDPHPPHEYRVTNYLRNSDAFAKDFHCPVGSKMNPIKKCNVW